MIRLLNVRRTVDTLPYGREPYHRMTMGGVSSCGWLPSRSHAGIPRGSRARDAVRVRSWFSWAASTTRFHVAEFVDARGETPRVWRDPCATPFHPFFLAGAARILETLPLDPLRRE